MAESIAPHRGSPPPNDALAAARVAFPQTPDEFEADPRVAFSKLDNKWELEEDDGSMWEYNEASQRWVPLVRTTLRSLSGRRHLRMSTHSTGASVNVA